MSKKTKIYLIIIQWAIVLAVDVYLVNMLDFSFGNQIVYGYDLFVWLVLIFGDATFTAEVLKIFIFNILNVGLSFLLFYGKSMLSQKRL